MIIPKKDEVMKRRQNKGNSVTSVRKGRREFDVRTNSHPESHKKTCIGLDEKSTTDSLDVV
jgi:hypothetical protein